MELQHLVALLLSTVCLQLTATENSYPRITYDGWTKNKTVNAVLFVTGIDKEGNGVVQTVLEHLGLWETINWIGLYHWEDNNVTHKKLNADSLEESVYNLKSFRRLDVTFSGVTMCEVLESALGNAEDVNGTPVAVLIQLPGSGAEEAGPKKKKKISRKKGKGKQKKGDSNGTPTDDQRCKTTVAGIGKSVLINVRHPKSRGFKLPKSQSIVLIEAHYLESVPNDTVGWKELKEVRTNLTKDLELAFPELSFPDMSPRCFADVPKQEECPELREVCKNYLLIDFITNITDERECPEMSQDVEYCRPCFGNKNETQTVAPTTEATKQLDCNYTRENETHGNGTRCGNQSKVTRTDCKGSFSLSAKWIVAIVFGALLIILTALIVGFYLVRKHLILSLRTKLESPQLPTDRPESPPSVAPTQSTTPEERNETKQAADPGNPTDPKTNPEPQTPQPGQQKDGKVPAELDRKKSGEVIESDKVASMRTNESFSLGTPSQKWV